MTSSGVVVGEPTFDDPKIEPAPDSVAAPHGWTFDRGEKRWRPKKPRGRGRSAPSDSAAKSQPVADEPARDRDPDPSWFADKDTASKGKLKYADVPRQVKDDIAGLAGLVGIPILSMLQQIDPYCGGALAESYEGIVDACLPLICRSEKVVKYFTGDKSDWLLWGKLGLALKPFAQAVIQHHVIKSVEVVRDEHGTPYVQPRQRGADLGDHLTPPVVPEYNYAA